MPDHRYEEIAEILRRQILSGELRPGQQIDTQYKLAADNRVSRIVVRQALAVLREEGLVESRRGGGTVVTSRSRIYLVVSADGERLKVVVDDRQRARDAARELGGLLVELPIGEDFRGPRQ